MRIIKPKKLEKGDTLGIVSPSEPIIYKKKLLRGVENLKKLGFKIILGKNVFKTDGGYTAGFAKGRAADMNAMIKNPKVRGIFASHGGFNSNELLDLVDYEAIKKYPKIFHGFSDITVLLNAIYAKTGLITFHGQNVEYGFSRGLAGRNKFTLDYFLKAEASPEPVGIIKNKEMVEIIRRGRAVGRLVGGNLSVLMTLIGTPYEPDWNGKILFWEEVDQTAQDIHFWLTHLRLAGVFEKISGMVIGKLANCVSVPTDADWVKTRILPIKKIILNTCGGYNFPIIKNIQFGHCYPQITVPVGVKAEINTAGKNPFSIVESAVE